MYYQRPGLYQNRNCAKVSIIAFNLLVAKDGTGNFTIQYQAKMDLLPLRVHPILKRAMAQTPSISFLIYFFIRSTTIRPKLKQILAAIMCNQLRYQAGLFEGNYR